MQTCCSVTEALKKNICPNDGMIREKILVEIPQSDLIFFRLFANKFGWQINNKQTLWDEFIKNSPENVQLSDEEIMEEIRAVRYGEVQNNN